MGILDKAVVTARKAAQQGLDQAKEKGQELTLRRRLNALAEELGHLTFRQHQGETGLDAEAERLVGEMRATKSELDASYNGAA